jgi:hypothetical protein
VGQDWLIDSELAPLKLHYYQRCRLTLNRPADASLAAVRAGSVNEISNTADRDCRLHE